MELTNISDLNEQLLSLNDRLIEALATDASSLADVRMRFLGKTGQITLVRRWVGTLPKIERPEAGEIIDVALARLELLVDAAVTQRAIAVK